MAVTPTAGAYQRNGRWYAPIEDFGYGQNPYDPDTQPELYNQWQGQHQGDAQQIGQDYSPGRVGAIIGGTVGAGALADALMAPAAVAAPSLASAISPTLSLPAYTAGTLATPATAAVFGGAAPTAAMLSTPAIAGPAAAAPAIAGPAAAATGTGSFLTQLQRYMGVVAPIAQDYLSNRANNQARDQLQTSITQAKSDLAKLHQQQMDQLSPYTSLGGGAASLLGQGLGIKVQGQGGGLPSAPMGTGSAPGNGYALAPSFTPGKTSPLVPGNGVAFPGSVTPSAAPQSALAAGLSGPQVRTQSSYSGTVRVQAPTGEIALLSPAQAQQAVSKGAKVL